MPDGASCNLICMAECEQPHRGSDKRPTLTGAVACFVAFISKSTRQAQPNARSPRPHLQLVQLRSRWRRRSAIRVRHARTLPHAHSPHLHPQLALQRSHGHTPAPPSGVQFPVLAHTGKVVLRKKVIRTVRKERKEHMSSPNCQNRKKRAYEASRHRAAEGQDVCPP